MSADKIAASYEQLKVAAAHLNKLSESLGKPITELEQLLQRLNLGVIASAVVDKTTDNNDNFTEHSVGYGKLGSKWGIFIGVLEGNHNWDPDQWDYEQWPFNEAPRRYRIKAVDGLPELLDKLSAVANETAEKIEAKISSAENVVAAIKGTTGKPSSGTSSPAKKTTIIPDANLLVQVLQRAAESSASGLTAAQRDALAYVAKQPALLTGLTPSQMESLRQAARIANETAHAISPQMQAVAAMLQNLKAR